MTPPVRASHREVLIQGEALPARQGLLLFGLDWPRPRRSPPGRGSRLKAPQPGVETGPLLGPPGRPHGPGGNDAAINGV